MIRPPHSFSFFPPIVVPDPEVLQKYGKIALHLLLLAKNKATDKGREHKQMFRKLCS